jgi:hypothetical protein
VLGREVLDNISRADVYLPEQLLDVVKQMVVIDVEVDLGEEHEVLEAAV